MKNTNTLWSYAIVLLAASPLIVGVGGALLAGISLICESLPPWVRMGIPLVGAAVGIYIYVTGRWPGTGSARSPSDMQYEKLIAAHAIPSKEIAGPYCVWMGHRPIVSQ